MSVLPSPDPTSLLLGGVVLLCLLWWMSTRRPPGLPPGPGPALPVLGHLHLMSKDPRDKFSVWRRQYGDVFSLYMGGRLVVVLTGYSAIREALVTFADVFSDRPYNFIADRIAKKKGHIGLVNASGLMWKEQRKTSLEILREMGMGKNVLAEKIQEEITHYIRAIKDHRGAPKDLAQLTQLSVCNNVCSIMFGKRFDYQDPEFISCLQRMDHYLKLMSGTAMLRFIPALFHLPGDPFQGKELLACIGQVYAFMGTRVADHQKTLDKAEKEEEENNDFIYSYLQHMRRHNTMESMSDENLQKCVCDLFAAGTETTSTALQWALLFFLHHPDIQDKCFKELSDVIGPHRLPTMCDKPNLTYLEATICEVLRKGDIGPLALSHATARDVTFRDYIIPKGATVIPFLSSVLQDPEIWGDPENFRPERFINSDGKLTHPEEFIPFGTGRRVCMGESLARMELFLYLATLIQHFHFLPPEDGQLPSLQGKLGMAHSPQPYKIRAVPRN